MPFLQQEAVIHPFDPVWNADSRVLILGSFPSVKSREVGFYYGHPQNRFWPVFAALYGEEVPMGTQARCDFALAHGVALWDVLHSCTITGSSDASIRDAVPNDIASLLEKTRIRRVFCNGQRSFQTYERYLAASCGISAAALPSTSAANAAWRLERLVEAWRVILEA